MRKNLTEASATKEAYERLTVGLTELGLNKYEIRYLIGFHKEIVNLKLLDNSNYFKNFPYEGELFDIKNIQKFSKFPEAFYDIVLIVLHNKEFLSNYKVKFNGIDLKITKSAKEDKEKNLKIQSTPFDEYKVAEDENYYTFFAKDYPTAASLRTFFAKVYPNDKRIKGSGIYYPTWCIVSSDGSRLFNSQKIKTGDVWLITYTKQNPADLWEKYENSNKFPKIPVKERDPKDPPIPYEKSIDENQKAKDSIYQFLDAFVGEIYLMDSGGSIEQKRDYTRGPGSDNYGYHAFTNSPGHGVFKSFLEVSPSYNYSDIDMKNPTFFTPFIVEGGTLISTTLNSEVIKVPEGVYEIAEGAFSNLSQLKQVVLPTSTRIIRSGAFVNTPSLSFVNASNSLEIIESEAFEESKSKAYENLKELSNSSNVGSQLKENMFIIGNFEKVGNEFVVSKPSQLRHLPKEINSAYRKIQNNSELPSENPQQTMEERYNRYKNKKLSKESFRVARDRYEQTDLYSIEGSTLTIDATSEVSKNIEILDLSKISGIEKIRAKLKERSFENLREIILPEGVEDISKLLFGQLKSIRRIDLSITKITEIPSQAFFGLSRLREVFLPETLKVIGEKAFSSSGIDKISIPSETLVSPNAFKNTPFMQTIATDSVETFKERQAPETLEVLEKQKIKIIEQKKEV